MKRVKSSRAEVIQFLEKNNFDCISQSDSDTQIYVKDDVTIKVYKSDLDGIR